MTRMQIEAASNAPRDTAWLPSRCTRPLRPTRSNAQADHFFVANNADELSFEDGDALLILAEDVEPGWVTAELRGNKGLAPLTHITLPKNPTRVQTAAPPISGLSGSDVDRALEEMRSVVDRVLQESANQAPKPASHNVRGPVSAGNEPNPVGSMAAPRSGSPMAIAMPNKNRNLGLPLHALPQLSAPLQGGSSVPPDDGLKLTKERLAMLPFRAVAAFEYTANDSDEVSFNVGAACVGHLHACL
jgi:hypothetical protein